LDHNVALSGYDAATGPGGTTYIGWISSSYTNTNLRQVHLCVINLGSGSCAGGVQTASALSPSGAQDLHVVITSGHVELVWIAQVGAATGQFSAVFGSATVTNGVLGTSTSISGAPTYGTLTSVIANRSGGVTAVVIGNGTYDTHAYYYPSLTSTPKALIRPYFIGDAQVADNGMQTVVTTSQYGSVTGAVSVAHKGSNSSVWSKFSSVRQSITMGNIERLVKAHGVIYLLAGSTNAYYPGFTFRWGGRAFGPPVSAGDPNDVWSHDATTDASGRLASVSAEVGYLAVANFGAGQRPAEFRMRVSQTFAGGPAQLTTTPSGRAWLIYSVETSSSTGVLLYAQRIHLPGVRRTVVRGSPYGRVSLTGPASCMPISTVATSVAGAPARGWRVSAKHLRLGLKPVRGGINGMNLLPHHRYSLLGSVTFSRGALHRTVGTSLTFTTCGRP